MDVYSSGKDFTPPIEELRMFPILSVAPTEAIVAARAPIDLAPSNIKKREFDCHAYPSLLLSWILHPFFFSMFLFFLGISRGWFT